MWPERPGWPDGTKNGGVRAGRSSCPGLNSFYKESEPAELGGELVGAACGFTAYPARCRVADLHLRAAYIDPTTLVIEFPADRARALDDLNDERFGVDSKESKFAPVSSVGSRDDG